VVEFLRGNEGAKRPTDLAKTEPGAARMGGEAVTVCYAKCVRTQQYFNLFLILISIIILLNIVNHILKIWNTIIIEKNDK
jgi:hypothetical protein